MKRHYHAGFLLLPIVFLLLLWAYLHVGKTRTAQYVVDANGLTWTVDDAVLKADVEKQVVEVEFIEYSITVSDSSGDERFAEVVGISSDLGGGGFVKGMQVDDDSELELVYVLDGVQEESFYLDVSADGVVKKTLSRASKQALADIDEWLSFNVVNPFAIGALLVVCLAYYVLYFPVFWTVRAVTRYFSRRRATLAT